MTKLSRILRDYADTGALSARINIAAAVSEDTFVTKSGDLMMLVQIKGIDYECLDAPQIDYIARRFEAALRTFDENFRVYQYLIKRDHASIPYATYENPVVQQAALSRLAFLQEHSETLYTLDLFIVVLFERDKSRLSSSKLADLFQQPVARLKEALSAERKSAALEADLEESREILTHKLRSFIAQLPETLGAKVLNKQEAFTVLRQLVNYAPNKSGGVRLKFDDFVDYQLCDSSLECYRDHLRLDDFHVSVLTLKEPPSRTFAHMLRGFLEIRCNTICVSEWKREPNPKMIARINSKRRHFHNSKASLMNYVSSNGQSTPNDMLINNAAVAQVTDLGACLEELEVKGRSFGSFSLSVALFDKDHARVKRAAAECFKVFASHDARVIEETYNLLNAWLAILPGNSAYNLRRLWLLDSNYADLSFLFTNAAGEVTSPHLRGAEYLAALETNQGTPYFFNLHCGDIGHTLILGATGSGKTFFLNFLLTHAQKYLPMTYIFDLGGGYQNAAELFGGAYLKVGLEHRDFRINPFSLSPTAENLNFLFCFVRVLVESTAYKLSAHDEKDLYEQIDNLYALEPAGRRLFTLSNMLGRGLRLQLQKWVQGGPYAALFDNAEDNLTFSKFQAFDFEGMDKAPQILEPLLFYILHRANAAIGDPAHLTTLKLFVLDEAWRFFSHPTIRQYIVEALKTWRKKNAAMILATQSSADLAESQLLPIIIESCLTKMFLANPDMDRKLYRELFHLNETEANHVAQLIPKQQILIKRPELAKLVNLRVGPRDYWLYTSNPFERQRRQQAFERHGFERGLEVLARSPRI
jgi:type IV secretion/conjugal transfer VirB4 family ATPase